MAIKGKRGGKAGSERPNLIIRKEEIIEGGGHGGAWKVAYADFVTAMMAFFLLMWLINATSEVQRIGLSDYFSQSNVLNDGHSGEGKIFGGSTPNDKGALSSDRGAIQVRPGNMPVSIRALPSPKGITPQPTAASGQQSRGEHQARSGHLANTQTHQSPHITISTGPGTTQAVATTADIAAARNFAAAIQTMQQAIRSDPVLSGLANQVRMRITRQGLRIDMMDTNKRPMFPLGSVKPNATTRRLITAITPVLATMSDPIQLNGYTDARPYLVPGYSNWDLSIGRANETRRLLLAAGLDKQRIASVSGYADRGLLVPDKPLAAANRRVSILVVHPLPRAAITIALQRAMLPKILPKRPVSGSALSPPPQTHPTSR
jgi:chemotaxis protein MotB